MKKVKLTVEGSKKLYKQLGLEEGVVKVKSGIVCLDDTASFDVIQNLHRNFGVQSVDDIPFEAKFISSSNGEELLKERVRTIGSEVIVGTIVRLMLDRKVVHVVVISISDQTYKCALMNLKVKEKTPCPENRVRLSKGNDVIYRNTTYKDVVEVTSTVISDVKYQDFIKYSGGMIVGRIINELTMIQVCRMCDESSKKNIPNEKQAELQSVSQSVPENTLCENASDENVTIQEESVPEPVAIMPEEKHDIRIIDFEKCVKETESLEELIAKLKIQTPYLIESMRICCESQRCNLKSLYAQLQARVKCNTNTTRQLSQNAIKNVLTQEFSDWNSNVVMVEYNISYFLKTVFKNVKSK